MDLLARVYDSGFDGFSQTLTFLLLFLLLFLLSKWLKDFFTPYKLNDELTQKDNLAIALTMAGYYLGVTAIFIGAFVGPSQGLFEDFITVGGYSILGLVFLNLSRFVNDKLILKEFCNVKELTEEHNNAVGVVQFGIYLATGLIAAGSVAGTGGNVFTAVAFFVIGQIALLLFTITYNKITPYCIHEALKNKNIAVGAALAGNLIALGIIVVNGVSVNFVSWEENITYLVAVTLLAVLFLPIIRFFMDKMIVPGDSLSREIIAEHNVGAGCLEATVVISFAIVLNIIL